MLFSKIHLQTLSCLLAFSFIAIFSGTAIAQEGTQEQIVPDRRIAITKNMDFFGSDLQPIFQTTLRSCQKTCLNDSDCQAFTYNTKSSACFPKSAVSELRPFAGAISARVYKTDPKVLETQEAKAKSLEMLTPKYLREARTQAESLARDYVSNQWSAEQLVEASRSARDDGKYLRAMKLMGAALSLSDAPFDWVEMATLALKASEAVSSDRRKLQQVATSAAINGYLRDQTSGGQVSALNVLATGVERRGNERTTIAILRLAQSISSRLDTETALTRAISLFGLRITDNTVDNNAASPRICATFSDPLVKTGVDYGDFVRLPTSGLSVESRGNQICVSGVRHGEKYRLTFRAGLPDASGEKLIKPVDITVYVRDRDPSARFVGRGYVLPKGATAAIPIVTVNLSKVDLKIHRIGDRNLVRSIQQGYFAKPLSFWDEKDLKNSIGEEVWSGTGIVKRDVNQDVTTSLPIGDAIAKFEPGVYVLRARVPGADVYDKNAAAQWFVVTDLGLATMKGGDGLHVFVRSLSTAKPAQGVVVQLVAKNNNILGEAITDQQGYARFAPGLTKGSGGAAPVLVTVAKGDDFSFLSLKDGAFDLSDRGVDGRPSPPPIDVFLATDRGAYRVGETVFTTALVRNSKAEALSNLPLTAIITRPDGVEFSREFLKDQGAGGRVFAVNLPSTAQRGTWTIRVYADVNSPALNSQKFLVEDLIPERIDFDLALQKGPIKVTDVPIVTVNARYLYGAPGAGLTIEAETRVSRANGLQGYRGFRFGRSDDVFRSRMEFTKVNAKTDSAGQARFGLVMPKLGNTSLPLKMRALVRLKEGSGRPVERVIETNLAPSGTILGIKPLFDGVVPEGGVAGFETIAVGVDLTRKNLSRVGWVLNKVNTRYQWYETYGNWKYEAVTTRNRVASGEISLMADGINQIESAVDWGRYELVLETLDGPYLAASYTFFAGWYAPAISANTPDTLSVGLDKDIYKIGDTAQLRLVPRYAGTALVTVVSNRLIDMKTVNVVKGENLINLDVTEDWGAGAYVSATVIRPMNTDGGHNPARALGLSWAKIDPGKHKLDVSFTTADEVSPRGTMLASLQVNGVKAGETAYATIAAVDVGILNLTRYKSPDPNGHYFGQRKLGMEIRDVYGRLIDGSQGTPGQIRSGGDTPNADGVQSPPPTEQLVAFFSGPITVGADDRAVAEFDMPEFNGSVRLMAIVWSKTGVGQASKDILVRDPVVLTASLPRFLAPYDKSRMLLELAHASGPTGDVAIKISASDGLFIDTSNLPDKVNLSALQKVSLSVPIEAPAFGNPEITVVLTTPGGKTLTKTLLLPVRVNDPEISRTSQVELGSGDTFTLNRDIFTGYMPGTGRATLAVGPIARFDAPGLLAALDRYPYGCTEQITSKALPLLYFGQVARTMGLAQSRNISDRINQAITEVLSNQSSNGAFGLWRPGSGDLWLDAYVSDFLSRARAKGYAVPNQAFRLAMNNLRNRVNYAGDFEYAGQDIAYALMVLAREGIANIGDMRYYADTKADNFATPLALAQLGSALAYYGDQRRADAMFRKAGKRLDQLRGRFEPQVWRTDYGTDLRDTAAVLALAVEAGSEVLDAADLARRISPLQTVNRARSTQENMWSLMAANALIEETPEDAFLVNGKPVGGPVVQIMDAQTGNDREIAILNNSGKSATTVLTTYGVPTEPEPAGGNGYSIERTYFTLDGKPTTLEQLTLKNPRLVVVLKVTPERYFEARLMVNDPLPAGLEIDNPNLLKSGDIKELDWLNLNANPQHTEFRADRFLAAVDWSSKKPFQLAYMVRAISPGTFYQPAASVEDMYRPQFRARTGIGQVKISVK